MKYPFLFRVCRADPRCLTDTEAHEAHGGDEFIVYIAFYDYKYADMAWADDSTIGPRPRMLDVDFVEQDDVHRFATEKEAMIFIREWWRWR